VQRSRGIRAGHPGLLAAATVLAVSGIVGAVGVAGAAEERQAAAIYASEDGSWCFTTDVGLSCSSGAPANVTINVGETVDFHFPGNPANPDNNYTQPHNAAAGSSNWSWTSGSLSTAPQPTRTTPPFNQPGTYTFLCQAHPFMNGTIRVNGDPTGTPTQSPSPSPDPTATATATPTPTTTPTPPPSQGGHVTTPPPTRGTDTVDPTVAGVRLTARRRAVRVRFRLSEPATITIRIKRRGSRRVLKSARVQARAGTRTVTLRSRKLKKGRYTLDIRARDAFGNLSSLTTKRLTLR
jgi:plastocyanin